MTFVTIDSAMSRKTLERSGSQYTRWPWPRKVYRVRFYTEVTGRGAPLDPEADWVVGTRS
jgi:hypothetical protein